MHTSARGTLGSNCQSHEMLIQCEIFQRISTRRIYFRSNVITSENKVATSHEAYSLLDPDSLVVSIHLTYFTTSRAASEIYLTESGVFEYISKKCKSLE